MPTSKLSLEQQLQELAGLGVRLKEGVTVEDLFLHSSREEFEEEPGSLLLWALGSDLQAPPWGRHCSDDVWTLDTECVHDGGKAYVRVVQSLARISGQASRISHVTEKLDFAEESGEVTYKLDGRSQTWDIEIRDDWLDLMVLSYVAAEFERDSQFFAVSWSGQTACLVFTDKLRMTKLQRLTDMEFERLIPE